MPAAAPAFAGAPDYAEFLRQHLAPQPHSVASYAWQGEQLWLKKAGPRHGMWRYHLLGALARLPSHAPRRGRP